MSNSDVALRKISEMQDEHAGDFTISPEASRYRHVQLRWHYVREIVEAQSSLMAVDPLGDLSPIPGPERPKHQVRALASRKARQPIDSPMLTNPITGLNVIRVSILRKPRSFSLLRRKVTLLPFRYLVEPFDGLFAFMFHITILQLI
jgi:hypothetical protein